MSGAITPDVGPVTAMRWLDAETLLVAHDRLLRGYARSGEIRCEVEAPAGIRSLWILEGRRILVTGHEDGSIRTWKVPGWRARGSAVSSFEFSKTYSVATSAVLAAAPQLDDPCISWIAAEGAAGHFRTNDMVCDADGTFREAGPPPGRHDPGPRLGCPHRTGLPGRERGCAGRVRARRRAPRIPSDGRTRRRGPGGVSR